MKIDAKLIQKLRSETGAGVMDIKKAFVEAEGDEEKVKDILKAKGEKIAAKKQAERVASQGMIEAYVHANGKMASLVMLACETDFVARNSEFKDLAHDIAMQVAAMNPLYLSPEKVPSEVIEKEKKLILEQLEEEKKPKEVMEKIVLGRLGKFYEENCLLKQRYIKDDEKTIEDLINEKIAKLGEKIEVKKWLE